MDEHQQFNASKMPIKQRIQTIDVSTKIHVLSNFCLKLQICTKDAIKGLNDNKKDTQLLRSECATLEHQSTECLNDILKEVLEDVNNLEKDFRKLQQADLNEIGFLKQQATQL